MCTDCNYQLFRLILFVGSEANTFAFLQSPHSSEIPIFSYFFFVSYSYFAVCSEFFPPKIFYLIKYHQISILCLNMIIVPNDFNGTVWFYLI